MSYTAIAPTAFFGLGAEGTVVVDQDRSCPYAAGSLGPAVSQEMKTWLAGQGKSYTRTYCQTAAGNPTKELCNRTFAPRACYIAKLGSTRNADGTFRNRAGQADGTQGDWEAWAAWMPAATPMTEAGVPLATASVGESSDTLFYAGLAAAALLVGGGVWYATR